MKPTARARIEQAVKKEVDFARGNRDSLPIGEVQFIMRCAILAERARLKRGVKKQQQDAIAMSNDSKWWDGYIAATKDILSLWKG